MTKEMILKRKDEIKELLEDETQTVNLEEIEKEIGELDKQLDELVLEAEKEVAEEVKEEEVIETPAEVQEVQEPTVEEVIEEKRKIIEKLNTKSVMFHELEREEKSMNYTVESPEYRTAWAKTLMRKELNEVEKRALGDAVTTTATDFVASAAEVNGINNGGLFIPTSVRNDILKRIEESSPFYRDIKKLAVAGNIDLPFVKASDDAAWYAELTDTKNEGIEFAKLSLTGHELAKNVIVTWKLEAMAVEDFINFLVDEIASKMGKALVNGVLYGTGANQPIGALHGLQAQSGDTVIEGIFAAYESLVGENRIGAKAYISTGANLDLVSYKDGNDNFPFLQGIASTKLLSIEVDPYLTNNDILVGNPANYVFNTVQPMTVVRDSNVIGRKTTYGAYGVFDGKPKTGAFAKGSYTIVSA